jgi:hypothetical protein
VRYTRLAIAFGVLALIGLCILASIGFTPAIAVLVTFAVLVLFVAVGNLVSGRPGPPRFARPAAEPAETMPADAAPAERTQGDGSNGAP